MWRQSTLPSLRLWQTALEATKLHVNNVLGGIRHNSSAGARKVAQLERELARLKATSLEQLQAQARQQVSAPYAAGRACPRPAAMTGLLGPLQLPDRVSSIAGRGGC